MRSTQMSQQRSGYTLLELYVGMSILAIVFVIVMPVFTQNRGSRQTSCVSNSKQIGLAVLQYVQDYDENFPSGRTFPAYSPIKTSGMGWAGQVYPYLKSETVFRCPDDPTKDIPAEEGQAKRFVCSYLINANLADLPLDALTAPASTVLGCEGRGNQIQFTTGVEGLHRGVPHPTDRFSASTDGLNYIYYKPDGKYDGSVLLETGVPGGYATHPLPKHNSITSQHIWFVRDTLGGRHTDGSVFIAGDGHAKFLKPDAVSVGHNASAAAAQAVYPGVAAGTNSGAFHFTFSRE